VFTLWLAYTTRTFPVGEWAREWRRQAVDDDRAVAVLRQRADWGREELAVGPVREAVERRARKVATDFLRACRNRDAGGALNLADVPFYTGAAATTLLHPEAELVIRDRGRLHSFFDGQLRQVRPTEQMPSEAIRIVSYEAFTSLEAEVASTAALDDALTPTDFVVGVGRDGRETGRVFVRVRNNQIKVVGMTK
jgi:hypothetical protein